MVINMKMREVSKMEKKLSENDKELHSSIDIKNDEGNNLSIIEIVHYVKQYLQEDNHEKLQMLFEELHDFDMYQIFDDLGNDERHKLIMFLPLSSVAAIFSHLEAHEAKILLDAFDTSFATLILDEMSSDDSTEILREYSRSDANTILNAMDKEQAQQIRSLLFFDDKSAGSIMSYGMLTVSFRDTVKEAMKKVVKNAPEAETVSVIYVLNDEQQLCGVLSLRELIVARSNELIHDIMIERVISVQISETREAVAKLMTNYDLTVVPVINENNQIEGIITIDDAVDIIREEAEEDYFKLAGISESEAAHADDDYFIIPSLKKRLPWLLSMIFLSIIVSSVILFFQKNLNSELALVLIPFMTLVNNMTGVPGIQASAVAMMRVVKGEFKDDPQQLKRFIFMQFFIILSIAIIIGVVDGLFAYGLSSIGGNSNFLIFYIIVLSIFISSTLSSMVGILSVLFLDYLGKDPAVASGPFMSTIGDLIGITIYFTVANIIYMLI